MMIKGLFNKPAALVKAKAKIDMSDIGMIKELIIEHHSLPPNHLEIRVAITSTKDPEHPRYRASLIVSRSEGKQKGKYIGDTFVVRKMADNEFLFQPPLGEKQCRKSRE